MYSILNIGAMLSSVHSSNTILQLIAKFRVDALSMSSVSVKLAMGLACVFVVFMMIRMSFKMMSDDDRAGFGGITLWEILRPVIILIMIQTCPIWIDLMDRTLGGITSAVSKPIEAKIDNGFIVQMMIDTDKALTGEEQKFKDDLDEKVGTARENNMINSWLGWTSDGGAIRRGISAWEKENNVKLERAAKKALINSYKTPSGITQNSNGELTYNIHDENFIPMICNWLYDKFFVVIMIMAEVILMILAMLCPWTLVFSLLPPWHNAINQFFGSYVQVSFWQIIATFINLVSIMLRKSAAELTMTIYGNAANQALKDTLAGVSYSNSVEYVGAANWLTAIISIACLLLIFKVPKIANALLPGGSDFGDMGTAGFGVMTGAAENATKLGGSAAKTVVGGAIAGASSARRSRQQQQSGR